MKTLNGTVTPELRFEITQENYDRAITQNSGGCIVADAIKEQYPQFSNVKVDVATVRFTDKERGLRYVYLTPPSVSDTLLFFDQGWKEDKLPKTLRLRTTLKLTPIIRNAGDLRTQAEQRAARLEELEAKEQSGELTPHEKGALTRLRNPKPSPTRPSTYGPTKGEEVEGSDEVVVIGRPQRKVTKYGRHQANMLAGKDRHFGAKTAKPGVVFQEAVKAAVEADRAERSKKRK